MQASKTQFALIGNIYRLMSQRDFQGAGKLCEQITAEYPEFDQGWNAAAEFFLRVSNPSRALNMVQRAVALSPGNPNWLLQQARCLMECGQTAAARDSISKLGALGKLSPQQHNELGMLLARVDDHSDAQAHYRQAVAAQPREIEFLFNLATSQRFLGQIDEAEKTLDTVLKIEPADHEAAAMRSTLRKQTAEQNHVADLEKALTSGALPPVSQVSFCYALAKELEDLQRYPEAFGYLQQGATIRRSGMRYQVETDLEIIASIIATFDSRFFSPTNRSSASNNANEEAIFVIGLPRSGTTLLERILGSHSDVYAAGELGNFGIELTRLTRQQLEGQKPGRGEFVAASARIDFAELGRSYIETTRPLTGHTPKFIDKLPFNYLYAGLIHQALPAGKIISLRRHPMDSCYSMYKQLFRDAYPFSYDLQDLAEYYLAYHRLMDHWNTVIPGVMHTVQYESLVTDTETEARRLLEFCGLQWQDQCLEFHRNTSASTTASATQVRQKVYTSSVGKWQHYAKELEPLRQRLERGGVDCSPFQ